MTRAQQCKALQSFLDAVGGTATALDTLAWHLRNGEPSTGTIDAYRNREASGLVYEASELIQRNETWRASRRGAEIAKLSAKLEAKLGEVA